MQENEKKKKKKSSHKIFHQNKQSIHYQKKKKKLGLGGVCKTSQKTKKCSCKHKWSIAAFFITTVKNVAITPLQ